MDHRFHNWLAGTLACMFFTLASPVAHAADLTLALANSTCNVMKQVGSLYRASHPIQIHYVCKSSGLLAKGLRGGAISADVFVSADREWMDFAIENNLVTPDKVVSPWGNSLVVAVPKNSAMGFGELSDLASDKITTILIGDPSTAPFGRYTKDALEAAGLWDRVKSKIQTRKNIELLAESLANAGSTTVGILFPTNLTDNIRQVHVVSKRLHKPIRYYAAPLKAAVGNAEAVGFLKFLQSPSAQEAFRAERFDLDAP